MVRGGGVNSLGFGGLGCAAQQGGRAAEGSWLCSAGKSDAVNKACYMLSLS